MVWTKVKGGATEALEALKLARQRANAVAIAGAAKVQVVLDRKRVALKDARTGFVAAALGRKSVEAAQVYNHTLEEFLAGCTKTYADELTLDDVTRFHGQLRRRGMEDRTVRNRHMHLRAFLIYLKLDYKAIAGPTPKYEKTMPEIYEPEELKAFFSDLPLEYDRVLYNLLLTTGLREREG